MRAISQSLNFSNDFVYDLSTLKPKNLSSYCFHHFLHRSSSPWLFSNYWLTTCVGYFIIKNNQHWDHLCKHVNSRRYSQKNQKSKQPNVLLSQITLHLQFLSPRQYCQLPSYASQLFNYSSHILKSTSITVISNTYPWLNRKRGEEKHRVNWFNNRSQG